MSFETIELNGAIQGWLLTDSASLGPGNVFRFDPADGTPHCGVHPSERAIDALEHAHGTTLCRVAAWGQVFRTSDQMFAEFVRVEWTADARAAMECFAKEQQPDLFGPFISPLRRARMAFRIRMSAPIVGQKAGEVRRSRKHEMDGRLTEILNGLKPGM